MGSLRSVVSHAMSRPDFTVIIPAFNAERWLGDAIQSALAQTRQSAECLIVDDGSTDETLEVVRSFGRNVTCISQSRSGVSAARNRGAAVRDGLIPSVPGR